MRRGRSRRPSTDLPARIDDRTIADVGERLLGGALSTVVVVITAIGVLADGERDRAAVPCASCRLPVSARADAVGRIVYHSFGSYFAGSLLVGGAQRPRHPHHRPAAGRAAGADRRRSGRR